MPIRLSTHLSKDLRLYLIAILGRTQSRSQLNHLINVCHALSTVFIRSKITEACREARFQDLSYSDIAFDCIADLFQQDERGYFVQLEAYFSDFDYTNESDESLLSHLRRLVFSKVNQGIFRIYNETDPSLGRIIRNIKLAMQSLNNFDLVNRFDETCIVPSSCDSLEHLPPIERDELEIQLRNTAHGTETIPQLLAHLSRYLREQTEHSRVVQLVTVALVMRAMYQNQLTESNRASYIEDTFTEADTRRLIREACEHLKKETERKYVGKHKVCSSDFEKYFIAIEEHIATKVVGQDGEECSFFNRLQSLSPELTKNEYRRKHKSKIEYLARQAYDRTIALLKKHST